jgi:hypothetical protein
LIITAYTKPLAKGKLALPPFPAEMLAVLKFKIIFEIIRLIGP